MKSLTFLVFMKNILKHFLLEENILVVKILHDLSNKTQNLKSKV